MILPLAIFALPLHPGNHINHDSTMIREFKKLSEFASRHKVKLEPKALRKLTDIMTGKEKPTRETLDKLALLAGFQNGESWKKTFEE